MRGVGMILALLLLFLIVSIGCRPYILIHAITPDDIKPVEKGEKVGEWTATTDGWYVSNYYLGRVMNARIE